MTALLDEKPTEGQAEATRWQLALELSKKADAQWIDRGRQIVKRYRDERGGGEDQKKRYNTLWSNVETLAPAIYSRTPKADLPAE